MLKRILPKLFAEAAAEAIAKLIPLKPLLLKRVLLKPLLLELILPKAILIELLCRSCCESVSLN